jgi:hypothetical protein
VPRRGLIEELLPVLSWYWYSDEESKLPGHRRARCHDDQRTLTVSHGSSEIPDRHRCIGRSRRVDDARSSKLVLYDDLGQRLATLRQQLRN